MRGIAAWDARPLTAVCIVNEEGDPFAALSPECIL